MTKSRSVRILVIFSLSFINLLGQEDTTLQRIMTMADDTLKSDALYSHARQYLYSDREKLYELAQKGKELNETIDNEVESLRFDFLIATGLHFEGKEEEALSLVKEVEDRSRSLGAKGTLASILNLKCQIYQSKFQLEEALDAILESLEVIKEIGDRPKEAVAYHTIASTYQYLGENETAQKYLEKAIPIFEELDDAYRLGVTYQSLAVVSKGKEALSYANKGYEELKKTNDIQGQGMSLWAIGSAQYSLKRYDEAYENYMLALEIFDDVEYPEGSANMEANLASILIEQGRFNESLSHIKRAHQLAKKHHFTDVLAPVYKAYAKYYAHTGNAVNSMAFIDSLDNIKDTLYQIEKSQSLLETEKRLETKEKEAELVQNQLALQQSQNARKNMLIGALAIFISGLILFFVFRQRQIVKQKLSDAELAVTRERNKYLKELDEVKSNFFANVSHEFRTPLTLIIGPLNQMRKGIFTGDFSTYYEMMYRNASRLLDLVNQILELSKIESNKLTVHNEEGDIFQFARQITAAFQSWADQRGISYEVIIPNEDCWVLFDKDKVEKILVNLISNAMKYTSDQGIVTVKVKAEIKSEKNVIQIDVEDSGSGIPKEEIDQIFNKFYQLENSDSAAGTGIGLALTKELVNLFGGTINVESQVGEGSTFRVAIPFTPCTAKNVGTRIANIPKNQIDGNVKNLQVSYVQQINRHSILIVDDSNDMVQYISDYLSSDYNIHVAYDGKEGLEKAQKTMPDLIISDVMMPVMTGHELTQNIKSDPLTDHIPVILLTAKDGQKEKMHGLELGADDYLIKPFDSEELKLRVKNMINHSKILKEKNKQLWNLNPEEVEVVSAQKQFIDRLKECIESRLSDEQFSVEELAQMMGYSRSQLNRKIKAILDRSPIEIIRTFRLKKAKSLLEQGGGNVSEISWKVGYSSLSYFTKSFKKEFGILPSDITSSYEEEKGFNMTT